MIKSNLHDLVASRICHDLSSPIGACANGAELIAMTGEAGPDEARLIAQSAAYAGARVRFFRIAFGQYDGRQTVSHHDIQNIFKSLTTDRLQFDWRPDGDMTRDDAKAVFLALMCLERALPRGGRLIVKHIENGWSVTAEAETLLITEALWTPLGRGVSPDDINPATVSFALLPEVLTKVGRKISIRMTETRILIQI